MSKIDDKYDVIIIGAGIGGLVCGCYLAKAGAKVLIVEKNSKPGGYCTSFSLDGFTFDLGIHALEACGKEGVIGKTLQELELTEKVNLLRTNPSDIILTKNFRVNIWNDIIETRNELKEMFSKETRQIDNFFDLLINNTPMEYVIKFKNLSLKQVTNGYFRDKNLLNVFSILIRNIGVPLEKLSAINAMIFLKQYLKNGGYYPKGGMLKFSDILTSTYKNLGGKILFSTEIIEIVIKNKCIRGVIIKGGSNICSDVVISNCDATNTLSKYVKKTIPLKKYQNRIKKMKVSLPAFGIFLALNKEVISKDKKSCAIWYSKSENVDRDLLEIFEGKKSYDPNLVMITAPCIHDESLAPNGGQGICILTTASFRKNSYWSKAKGKIVDNLLATSSYILGDLAKKEIKHMVVWTPYMFNKITNNREGAVHGWAPLVDQIDRNLIPEKLPILGLYMVGHWTTQPGQGGLPMVFNSARSVSNMVLKKCTFLVNYKRRFAI